jgi:dihydroceramidase
MPWGIILELHGFWHIMTSISAYTFMAMIEYLTSPSRDGSQYLGFVWPARLVLGDIDLVSEQHSGANGLVGKEE